MIKQLLYQLLGKAVNISFNTLNLILAGNLPPLGCACVLVEKGGRLLVIEDTKDRFVFPGGFMRWREQPAQTAVRECEEETGLRLKIGELIGHHSIVSTRFDRMSTLIIIYQGEVVGGELRPSIEGQPCWHEAAYLRGRMSLYHEKILANYLNCRVRQEQQTVSGGGLEVVKSGTSNTNP